LNLQGIDSFGRRQYLELDFPAIRCRSQAAGTSRVSPPLSIAAYAQTCHGTFWAVFSCACGCGHSRSRGHTRKSFRQCRSSQMKILRNACAPLNSRIAFVIAAARRKRTGITRNRLLLSLTRRPTAARISSFCQSPFDCWLPGIARIQVPLSIHARIPSFASRCADS
jgi:hypothetical protein